MAKALGITQYIFISHMSLHSVTIHVLPNSAENALLHFLFGHVASPTNY